MLLSGLLALSFLSLSDATIVCSSHAKGNPLEPYNCNFRGSIGRPNPITPNDTITFTPYSAGDGNIRWACRNLCFKTAGCKSWSINYGASSGEEACQLYGSRIRRMKPGQADPNSQTLFTNKACQNAVLGGGIADPDFESGQLVGWSIIDGTQESSVSAAKATMYQRTSGFVARFQAGKFNTSMDNGVTLLQTTTLCQGMAYDVSFEYFIPYSEQTDPLGSSNFAFYVIGDNGVALRVYLNLKDGPFDSWTPVSVGTFQIAPNEEPYTQIQMHLGAPKYTGASTIVDNIVFTPTTSQPER